MNPERPWPALEILRAVTEGAGHVLAPRLTVHPRYALDPDSVERPVHWARHLLRTRELQRETGGFTEFVGLPFVHVAAPISLKRAARRGPTWREVVLMHAVARITYRGAIENIQASWVKPGATGAGPLLRAGSTTSAAR